MTLPPHSHASIKPAKSSSSPPHVPESSVPIPTTADASTFILGPDQAPSGLATSPLQSAIPMKEDETSKSASPISQTPKFRSLQSLDLHPPLSPRAGQKLRSPEYYGHKRAEPTQGAPSHMCSSLVPSASPSSTIRGSLTANTTESVPNRRRAQSLAEGTIGGSSVHPGYIQNPFAMEMTAEQRLFTNHENQSDEVLPMPNGTHCRRRSKASILERARRNTESLIDSFHDWFSSDDF